MTAFKAPVDEIFFSLEHVAKVEQLPDWDSELCRDIVNHFAEFAESEIAPLDEPGDIEGCRLENGRVYMPKGFRDLYQTIAAQGWPSLTAKEETGGQGMSAPVHGAVTEIFAGACHSLQMVVGLVPCAVDTLLHNGTPDQQERLIPPLVSGEWLATMALTEPNAGSDLSAIRTKATQKDGKWVINGEKIFISGGDQDISDGILHLVLARTGDMEDGTRGLSLFSCTSHLDDGSRNHIKVVRIEEKLGLHASPTCHMVFDDAEAELIGEEGKGLNAMFFMMNHARLDVSLQGVAHAARAAHISREYAEERIQGSRPGEGRVVIARHPDVARMLDEQDALTIGSRALCHIALVDLASEKMPDLVDFLTPVCKYFSTEAGVRSADLGIQILGGYGYLREYRIEQTLRDARITAIYEGSNGIHALTIASRLLKVRGGACADAFEKFVEDAISKDVPTAVTHALQDELRIWRAARKVVEQAEDPAIYAADFMRLTADVAYVSAWYLIRHKSDLAPNPERIVHLSKFVRANARPRISAAAVRLGVMTLSEELIA